MYILNSDFQNHTAVYTARLKWLLEFLLIKQNPLSLQNMLPFRTSSAPQQEGSVHSSDPPSPALLERADKPIYYSGFSKYTFRFSFYKGFLFETAQFLWSPTNYIQTRKWQHTTLCLNTKNQAGGIVPDVQQAISLLGNQ